MGVVNTFVNSEPGDADGAAEETYRGTALSGSEKVGAGRGTRTHTPVKVADFKSDWPLFVVVCLCPFCS